MITKPFVMPQIIAGLATPIISRVRSSAQPQDRLAFRASLHRSFERARRQCSALSGRKGRMSLPGLANLCPAPDGHNPLRPVIHRKRV